MNLLILVNCVKARRCFKSIWMLLPFAFIIAFLLTISSVAAQYTATAPLVDKGLSSQILLTKEEQAWLDRRHVVRVRVGNSPPYQIFYPEPQGISVDYLKLIGKRFGIDFRFVNSPVAWTDALNDLSGERKWCDLICIMKRTPEREKNIAFTSDYVSSPWVIINRVDSNFVSRIQDLKGKNVAVENGFAVKDLIEKEFPLITVVPFTTSLEALHSVASGGSDAYIANLAIASYLIRDKGLTNLKIAAPTPFGNHDQAMGVRKDWPELASIINKALMAMSDAEKSEISNRWLSVRYEYGMNAKKIWSWISGFAVIFLLILAFIMAWNRRLKSEKVVHERLLSILEAATNELYVFDINSWVFTYVNKSALNNLGYTFEQLKTMTPLDIKTEFSRDDFERLVTPLLSHEKTIVNFETTHSRMDGTTYPVEVTYRLVEARSSSSSSSHFLAVVQDISRRKATERELKRSVERLELLQEVSQYRAATIQELLDFSLEKVIALTESSIGYIYHYNEDTEQFTLNTWSKNVMASCRVAEPQSIYHLDKTGLWGEVVRQRCAIMVNDYAAPDEIKKGYPEGHVPLSRFLSIPVFDKEIIVAVVGVANKVLPYDQTDQLQLTLMMDGVWKIASRLNMEERLVRAGHEWQKTFDSINDSISLIDVDQHIKRCNLATSHLLGLEFSDIIHQPCWKLFHGSDTPIADCPMVRSKNSLKSESATIKHNGRWLEVAVDPILSDQGIMTGAVHIVRDVTERKRLEEELRTQASVIYGVLESTDSAVFSVDSACRYTCFNSVHKRIMKDLYNADIHLGDAVTSFMTNEDAVIAKANLDKALAGEMFVLEADSGDSTLVRTVFEISHNPIRNSKGVVEGVAIFARDISEERKTEESMREIQAQMMQNDKMATIGQLAAGVAHEINNPMGFVSSNMVTLASYINKYNQYIKLLEDEVRNPADESLPDQFVEARKTMKLDYVMKDINVLLEESNEGMERVKRIVKDLRTFSRADTSEMGLADLNSCIDSTINIVINEIKYSAEIERHYGELPKVSCNIQQISQVFMNLLINASHAIQAKGEELGEITITTWSDELNAFVSVSDNGCGITAERLGKIFDAFYTTKDVGKGTGLGLAISSGIVRKHGGEITVASEVGVGTVFTVMLPLKSSPRQPSEMD